jgi:uncharacterized membrane protein YfcA
MLSLWAIFLLVGAVGGFTAGLFGVGGGLVIVPTLYFLWRHDPVLGPEVMHFAVATSLACIVVTSVSSSWTHWGAKRLHFAPLPLMLAAVSLGAALAVLLARHVPTAWLKLGFGLFAASTCVALIRNRDRLAGTYLPRRWELLATGSVIGNVSTLLGVSGGAMTVPYLILRGVNVRQAVVVSSALAIPISVVGAAGLALSRHNTEHTWGYVHWPAFLGISVASLVFANWGARLSQTMGQRRLKLGFAGFLALVALHMLGF